MQKIMFNDRYGLTNAVLQGRKTMTRRVITDGDVTARHWNESLNMPHCYYKDERGMCQPPGKETWEVFIPQYKVGETVAVAQKHHGWTNKMFVHADLMPHQIRITDRRIERLQDISDEDCLREGVVQSVKKDHYYFYDEKVKEGRRCFWTPREAFAALIDKVSGRGTWQRNPWVWVYEFELAK